MTLGRLIIQLLVVVSALPMDGMIRTSCMYRKILAAVSALPMDGNVVHIAVLVKYTLVSQITRVTCRFYLQTSGPRFHYASILRVVSDDE